MEIFAHAPVARVRLQVPGFHAGAQVAAARLCIERIHVHAGTEAPSLTRQNDTDDRLVPFRRVQCMPQLFHHVVGERIQGIRPVQCDNSRGAVRFVSDFVVHDCSRWLPALEMRFTLLQKAGHALTMVFSLKQRPERA